MSQRIVRGRRRRRSRVNLFPIIQMLVTLALIIALVVLLVDRATLKAQVRDLTAQLQSTPGQSQGGNGDGSTASGTSSAENMYTQSQLNAMQEVDEWYLRLVNYENPLPDNFNVDVPLINSKYARNTTMRFDARAMEPLKQMCAAAEEDGINLLIISPYRTYNTQASLYNAEVQEWLGYGYSQTAAEDKAATIVARPGTSEHNLGLAVDFNSVEQSFDQTAAYRWLRDNAEDYGFIMRYAKDKEEITKVIYEPWHYRYVGVEHAKAINDLGYCLEEYIEYLKNGCVAP